MLLSEVATIVFNGVGYLRQILSMLFLGCEERQELRDWPTQFLPLYEGLEAIIV